MGHLGISGVYLLHAQHVKFGFDLLCAVGEKIEKYRSVNNVGVRVVAHAHEYSQRLKSTYFDILSKKLQKNLNLSL